MGFSTLRRSDQPQLDRPQQSNMQDEVVVRQAAWSLCLKFCQFYQKLAAPQHQQTLAS
jgi:hypothetical protein